MQKCVLYEELKPPKLAMWLKELAGISVRMSCSVLPMEVFA